MLKGVPHIVNPKTTRKQRQRQSALPLFLDVMLINSEQLFGRNNGVYAYRKSSPL